MKKYFIMITMMICFLCTGCSNQYFTLTSGNEEFHGAYTTRDFSHGDVQMYSNDGKVRCAGLLFINEFVKTKDENNKKNSEAIIELSCDDGRILSGKLSGNSTTNWTGSIQDQFKKEYEIAIISKKVFKENYGESKYTKSSYVDLINELVKY